MATRFTVLREDDEPEITVTWWLEREDGALKLCARAHGYEQSGVEQIVLSVRQSDAPHAPHIECDLLAHALGFRSLDAAL